jgi:hypothetical protein
MPAGGWWAKSRQCTYAPCGEKVKPEFVSADIMLSICFASKCFVSQAASGRRSSGDLRGWGLDTGAADGVEERYHS